jgi:hypothetical protein
VPGGGDALHSFLNAVVALQHHGIDQAGDRHGRRPGSRTFLARFGCVDRDCQEDDER